MQKKLFGLRSFGSQVYVVRIQASNRSKNNSALANKKHNLTGKNATENKEEKWKITFPL